VSSDVPNKIYRLLKKKKEKKEGLLRRGNGEEDFFQREGVL